MFRHLITGSKNDTYKFTFEHMGWYDKNMFTITVKRDDIANVTSMLKNGPHPVHEFHKYRITKVEVIHNALKRMK